MKDSSNTHASTKAALVLLGQGLRAEYDASCANTVHSDGLDAFIDEGMSRGDYSPLFARTTFTHSTCIANVPGFLSLSMKPRPLIWVGSTGPMP